ncbi:MAG: 16S rRNA (guanine(966)-N(2))-methyltransferase RsmD [Chloroflexota bacterium]
MRVITGTAKGKRLQEVPGNTTRPITDRVKEALFSILGDWIIDSRVLDLFGGTGSVGIEALSRGSRHVVFVEKAVAAQRTIQENLKRTGFATQCKLVRGDAFKFLDIDNSEAYDIIYIAPPQYKQLWQRALKIVDSRPELLTPDGIAIVQIHPKEFEVLPLNNLVLYDERKYGSTLLCFYEKPPTE